MANIQFSLSKIKVNSFFKIFVYSSTSSIQYNILSMNNINKSNIEINNSNINIVTNSGINIINSSIKADNSNINIKTNFGLNINNYNIKTNDNKFLQKKTKIEVEKKDEANGNKKKKYNGNDKFKYVTLLDYDLIKNIEKEQLKIIDFDFTEDVKGFEKIKNLSEAHKIINNVEEKNRVFINSDLEGNIFNLFISLYLLGVIDTNAKPISVYFMPKKYNFETNFSKVNKKYIELKTYPLKNDKIFKFCLLGDYVDRSVFPQGCYKTIVFLLYLKEILGDKLTLLCGNHELANYRGLSNDILCQCCTEKEKISITKLIIKAISLGKIKFFDSLDINNEKFMLTHKVIYKDDITYLKRFLEKNFPLYYANMKIFNNSTENIFDMIDVINKCFQEYFKMIVEFNLYRDSEKMFIYTDKFNVLGNSQIMIPTRINVCGIEKCISNQICGHDHVLFKKCLTENKILFADNYSYDKDRIPVSFLKFIDVSKDLDSVHVFYFRKERDEITLNNTIVEKLELEKYKDIFK